MGSFYGTSHRDRHSRRLAMTKTTRAQRQSLYRVWGRGGMGLTYRQFRATIQPTFGMDGAIILPWCGMWLAIEQDGYTHS